MSDELKLWVLTIQGAVTELLSLVGQLASDLEHERAALDQSKDALEKLAEELRRHNKTAMEELHQREVKVEAREKSLFEVRNQLALARTAKVAAEEREAAAVERAKEYKAERDEERSMKGKLQAAMSALLAERLKENGGVPRCANGKDPLG